MVAVGFAVTVGRRWAWLALAHPAITLVAIVATGNHYFLDAGVAGLLVLATVLALPADTRADDTREPARFGPITCRPRRTPKLEAAAAVAGLAVATISLPAGASGPGDGAAQFGP